MSDNKNIIKISDYYKDFNLPDKCFNCENLRNLLELTAENNVKLFNKKNNSIKLNSKRKIINECRKLKKIKLKELTKKLNTYTTETDVSSNIIKDTNNEYINNIENIDSIIKILNNDNDINFLDEILSEKKDEYIEVYSNT